MRTPSTMGMGVRHTSVSDVDSYVITIKLLDYICNIRRWDIQLQWNFFRKVACTRYDVLFWVRGYDSGYYEVKFPGL
jgi:hypothetical protein